LGIKKEDVTKIDYRGEGYLGSLSVTLKDGQKKSVPYIEYYNHWLRSFFYLPRCTLCIDHTCELADISFGDNWMPEFQKESIGSSILISRTKRAEELLATALETGRIELSKVERSRVVRSKKGSLIRKKNYLGTRMALFKLLGKRTPIYNQPLSKGGPFAYLDAIITYLQIYISQKRRLWRFLGTFSTFLKLASALKKEGS
jgi:coenzyme F420 hydrogenase subunit beta